ncbi:MAG: hypothetical protein WCW52_07005 [Elusimicrobiales bacterium]|jgi:hypothetical protein
MSGFLPASLPAPAAAILFAFIFTAPAAVLAGEPYAPSDGQRNYHLGASAQALVALRLIVDKKFMIDANGRSYYLSGISSPNSHSSERIDRGDISFTVLLHGPHAVGLQYVQTRRASRFPEAASSRQTVSLASFAYTLVFDPHFGAVEWRDGMDTGGR